jgi:hypothetical protein
MNHQEFSQEFNIFRKEYMKKSMKELKDLSGIKEIPDSTRPFMITVFKLQCIRCIWEKSEFFKEYKRKEYRRKEFRKEFFEKMLMELKRDYINTHGFEKYMIEEDTVKKEMFATIEKQLKMLLTWNIEQ